MCHSALDAESRELGYSWIPAFAGMTKLLLPNIQMKIYFGHSKHFDYQNELYIPIRESDLNLKHEIIFPHEKSDLPTNSKDLLKTCDLMIAEVSFPATGLGIELGWADAFGLPIICVYKSGVKASNSVKLLTSNFIEYSDSNDLIKKIEEFINGL